MQQNPSPRCFSREKAKWTTAPHPSGPSTSLHICEDVACGSRTYHSGICFLCLLTEAPSISLKARAACIFVWQSFFFFSCSPQELHRCCHSCVSDTLSRIEGSVNPVHHSPQVRLGVERNHSTSHSCSAPELPAKPSDLGTLGAPQPSPFKRPLCHQPGGTGCGCFTLESF